MRRKGVSCGCGVGADSVEYGQAPGAPSGMGDHVGIAGAGLAQVPGPPAQAVAAMADAKIPHHHWPPPLLLALRASVRMADLTGSGRPPHSSTSSRSSAGMTRLKPVFSSAESTVSGPFPGFFWQSVERALDPFQPIESPEWGGTPAVTRTRYLRFRKTCFEP
jgi:hypothetical protein